MTPTWVIKVLYDAGKAAVIPSNSTRKIGRGFDRDIYRACHLIENFFAKLKQCRAIAAGHDKAERNFLAAVYLIAAVLWLI